MSAAEHDVLTLSANELLDLLEKEGLAIEDRERAAHILGNVNYSRLKAYMVPFMKDREGHRFVPGASFEKAYALYGFDRRLRELIFHEMEKIEISVRTRMTLVQDGGQAGFWYLNPGNFRNVRKHERILVNLNREIQRSDNDAIRSYIRKHRNAEMPCWLALEATSMGNISVIFDEMKTGPMRSSISSYYGLDENTFGSWMRHLVYIRNSCAHHNRVWNDTMRVKASIPDKPVHRFPRTEYDAPEHIYHTMCVIKYLLDTIKPTNTFSRRLNALITGFPLINNRWGLSAMGFPEKWHDDPFWAE